MILLSQSTGWLNGWIAVRAPIAQKAPTVAGATKQFSFMPKYLPTTTSGPICDIRFRNTGPKTRESMIRALGLRRIMSCRMRGSDRVFSNRSM
jgi:hypothetical protein